MRIAVTGATGNAGTALLERLAAEPDVLVRGIARRPPTRPVPPYDRVEWHAIDVGDDSAPLALAEAFSGVDAVIHLAWLLQPSRERALLQRVNLRGTRQVAAAAVAAGVPHLVVASSVGAYSRGPKDRTVDETWPTGGLHTSLYSSQKAAVERMLDDLERDNPELLVSRVRPALIFQHGEGAHVADLFLGPLLPGALVGRLRLPVLPLPRQLVTQAVHAADVADAYWRVVQQRAGGAFNLAAEPPLTPRDFGAAFGARATPPVRLGAVRALVSLGWRLHVQRADPGWLDLGAYTPLMSTERARRELGWTPRHSSTETLREMLAGLADDARKLGSPSLGGRKRRVTPGSLPRRRR